ncbi:hypothetical protein FGD64_04520 [Candidatus Liberibacter asiaticus]|nr:hypothetical protein FGD64_04520 [Candidatus Liberibacter asiaticus]
MSLLLDSVLGASVLFLGGAARATGAGGIGVMLLFLAGSDAESQEMRAVPIANTGAILEKSNFIV